VSIPLIVSGVWLEAALRMKTPARDNVISPVFVGG
jgi:hypothetical protein